MRRPTWFERLIFGQQSWQWRSNEFAHRITQGRYVGWSFQGVPGSSWPRWAHEITGWDHHPPMHAERVPLWKDRRRVTGSVSMLWPEVFEPLRLGGGRLGRVGYDGRMSGVMAQLGVDTKRPLSWGWAVWGQRYDTEIPLPASGVYWTDGWPTPMFDRQAIITDPDGWVHELIQFDPAAPWRGDSWIDRALPNQALGWGRWMNGVLVDGKSVTAAGLPRHGYLWTRDSASNPHALALVVHDYVGADGTLTGPAPRCGELLALDTDSESYRRMTALGGECAAIAEALAEFGCRVIDRNGYADGDRSAPTIQESGGSIPHGPGLLFHADAHFEATNFARFDVALTDLRRAQ